MNSPLWHRCISCRPCGTRFPVSQESPLTYRIPKFVGGYFGPDSVFLTEGSILDPCFAGSNFANNTGQQIFTDVMLLR